MNLKCLFLLILRSFVTGLYGVYIEDFNIFYLFIFLELCTFFFIDKNKKNKQYFAFNLVASIFLILSLSLDIFRNLSDGINKSGNEAAFYEIISELSKSKIDYSFILQFYLIYEDILYLTISSFLFKIFHLKALFNIVLLNNYFSIWSILLIAKALNMPSIRLTVFSSLGILLFYSATGLRDLLGLLLYSLGIYFYVLKENTSKYILIIIIIIFQYFVRPLNAVLTLSFISSFHFLKMFKINNLAFLIYLILLIFLAKFFITNGATSISSELQYWKNNYDERIIDNSNNSILAQLRSNGIGFLIPLVLTSFGESPLIIINIFSFKFDVLLISFTSLFTIMVVFNIFYKLTKGGSFNDKNVLFLLSSFHSFLIFFLTDETRHRLFFIIIISFIVFNNNILNESSSFNRNRFQRNSV